MIRSTSLPMAASLAALTWFGAGCGGTDAPSGSGASDAVAGGGTRVTSVAPPASGCGSFRAPAVKDADGVVAKLPSALRERYAGYPYAIRKSAWADWKPRHDPPYTVGVQWAQLSSDFQVQVSKGVVGALKKNPDVGDVLFQSTGNNLDIGQQIAQTRSLIRKKPDLIVLQELAPDAFLGVIEEAARAGIPVVVALDSVPSPYAVNVNYNGWKQPAASASVLVRQMGGRGNLLTVRAIPGVGADEAAASAYDEVLRHCPGIKRAGTIYGNFAVATAKSETLKFLATHPQKISGVLQSAVMAPGIIDAFAQSGRPVPPVQDVTMMKASSAYWAENRATYRGVGMGVAVDDRAGALADVAGRMLAGDGVETTDVLGDAPVVTDANLAAWSDPSWTVKTSGVAPGPSGAFMKPGQLDAFFARGN
jgi:ribose transport system substrate-binding protein